MFIVNFVVLCSIALISCDQKTCRVIPINGEQMDGKCCVFIKDEGLRQKNSQFLEKIIKDSLPPIRNSKEWHESRDNIDHPRVNPEFLPNKIPPKPHAPHTKPEDQNVFVPPPDQNIILPIKGDKIYGECNVLFKNEENNKNVTTLMPHDFLPTKNPEDRKALGNKTNQGFHSTVPPPELVQRIASRRPDFAHPKPPQEIFETETNRNHHKDNNVFVDLNPGFIEASTSVSSNESSSFDNYEEKNSTVLEQETNTTIFTNDNTENPVDFDENVPHNFSTKHIIEDLPEDDSSNIYFPTEENEVTMKSPIVSSDNGTNFGKATVDLDNRNAVDVPPIGCPTGQTKDPSGKCVSPF